MLRGPSGAGKSDLALRLIHQGAVLVADDQVMLSQRDGSLYASPPDRLAGLIEVRGTGIVQFPFQAESRVTLVAELVDPAAVERMPEREEIILEDIALPLFRLAAFEASAPDKLRLALAIADGSIMVRS